LRIFKGAILVLICIALTGLASRTVMAQDSARPDPAEPDPSAAPADIPSPAATPPATPPAAAGTEQEVANADVKSERMSMRQLMTEGGWVGYIIIGCSVLAFSIALKLVVNLRRSDMCPEPVIAELTGAISEGRFDDAISSCRTADITLTRIVAAGLARRVNGPEEMQSAAAATAEEENARLQDKVGWLNILGNISPMLGLLGTVLGMVQAFNKIAKHGNPTAQDLAGDIQFALITTVQGLIVAIPCLAAYSLIKSMAAQRMMNVNAAAGGLLEIAAGKTQAAALPASQPAAQPPPKKSGPPVPPPPLPE